MYSHVSTNPQPTQIKVSSNWHITSDEIPAWPGCSPDNLIQLYCKDDITSVNRVEPSLLSWPQAITQSTVLEEFKVPIKIKTDTETEFVINLIMKVERISGINFGYYRKDSYVETINQFRGVTGDQWIMVPASAKHLTSIRGTGD